MLIFGHKFIISCCSNRSTQSSNPYSPPSLANQHNFSIIKPDFSINRLLKFVLFWRFWKFSADLGLRFLAHDPIWPIWVALERVCLLIWWEKVEGADHQQKSDSLSNTNPDFHIWRFVKAKLMSVRFKKSDSLSYTNPFLNPETFTFECLWKQIL